MNTLYVAWQDPETRGWAPVARLSHGDGVYRFEYTKGARNQRFVPFGRMTELDQVYYSRKLFPLFANRLLAKSRPEYHTYLEWLGVADETQDPMLLLARSGGARGTDLLEVFAQPQANEQGEYEVYFFSHGLRYRPPETLARINDLKPGDILNLTPDRENQVDSFAILLHTKDQLNVGFCPRYLAPDVQRLLNSDAEWRLIVARVNPGAPVQFRLLCQLVFTLPGDIGFFAGEDFQPIRKNS